MDEDEADIAHPRLMPPPPLRPARPEPTRPGPVTGSSVDFSWSRSNTRERQYQIASSTEDEPNAVLRYSVWTGLKSITTRVSQYKVDRGGRRGEWAVVSSSGEPIIQVWPRSNRRFLVQVEGCDSDLHLNWQSAHPDGCRLHVVDVDEQVLLSVWWHSKEPPRIRGVEHAHGSGQLAQLSLLGADPWATVSASFALLNQIIEAHG